MEYTLSDTLRERKRKKKAHKTDRKTQYGFMCPNG